MASAFVAVLRSSLAEGLCYPDVNASSLPNSRSSHLLTAAFKLNLSLDAYMFTKLGLKEKSTASWGRVLFREGGETSLLPCSLCSLLDV